MKLFQTLPSLCILLAFSPVVALAQDRPIGPGSEAPPLQVTKWLQAPAGFDGQWTHLRGKVVVLEFWATWCTPCIGAIPHLNQLAGEFRGRDVVFLAVTDDDEYRLKPFLAKQPMEAIIGIDAERKNWKVFGVPSIPHTIVIGKDSMVIGATSPENVTGGVLSQVLAGGKPVLPPTEGVAGDEAWDDHSIEWKDGVAPAMYAIVKPIKTTVSGSMARPGHISGDGLPLEVLVQIAYETDYNHLDWRMPKQEQVFRVAFRVPEERQERLLPYVRQTLSDLFGIQARWEKQERDVYVLRRIEGRGALPESQTEKELAMAMRGKITLRRQPVGTLCDSLSNYVLHAMAIDETGMDGRYDFDVPYQPGQPEVTTQALRELGFEAVKARRTVSMLVVAPESTAKR